MTCSRQRRFAVVMHCHISAGKACAICLSCWYDMASPDLCGTQCANARRECGFDLSVVRINLNIRCASVASCSLTKVLSAVIRPFLCLSCSTCRLDFAFLSQDYHGILLQVVAFAGYPPQKHLICKALQEQCEASTPHTGLLCTINVKVEMGLYHMVDPPMHRVFTLSQL